MRMHSFLLQFLELFNEYKCSPLYIMGESYGGHYVPHTCAYISAMNKKLLAKQAEKEIKLPDPGSTVEGGLQAVAPAPAIDPSPVGYINLQGLAIGNPDLDQVLAVANQSSLFIQCMFQFIVLHELHEHTSDTLW